jgi:hypothetical protein
MVLGQVRTTPHGAAGCGQEAKQMKEKKRKREPRADWGDVRADIVGRLVRQADGHGIASPNWLKGCPQGTLDNYVREHKSSMKDPSSTIFVEGYPVRSLWGVSKLEVLIDICNDLGLKWTQALGRGTDAARMEAAFATAYPCAYTLGIVQARYETACYSARNCVENMQDGGVAQFRIAGPDLRGTDRAPFGGRINDFRSSAIQYVYRAERILQRVASLYECAMGGQDMPLMRKCYHAETDIADHEAGNAYRFWTHAREQESKAAVWEGMNGPEKGTVYEDTIRVQDGPAAAVQP